MSEPIAIGIFGSVGIFVTVWFAGK